MQYSIIFLCVCKLFELGYFFSDVFHEFFLWCSVVFHKLLNQTFLVFRSFPMVFLCFFYGFYSFFYGFTSFSMGFTSVSMVFTILCFYGFY